MMLGVEREKNIFVVLFFLRKNTPGNIKIRERKIFCIRIYHFKMCKQNSQVKEKRSEWCDK